MHTLSPAIIIHTVHGIWYIIHTLHGIQGCQIFGFCPSNRIFQGISYATDEYHNLHGFLRKDSEVRGTLCAHACAHMTLDRGACASK